MTAESETESVASGEEAKVSCLRRLPDGDRMVSYSNPQKGAVIMGALFSVLLLVMFLGLQRLCQSGLAAGRVKG